MRRIARTAVIVLALVAVTGCALFGIVNEPDEVVLWGSQFILAWDPPTGFGADAEIGAYTLFYREYRDFFRGMWKELGTATATGPPRFRVNGNDLPPGRYEFGVRSVSTSGSHSEIHSSTDSDADPPTGWYLHWLGGTQ